MFHVPWHYYATIDALLEGGRKARPQRRALALVRLLPKHTGARRLGDRFGVVRRAVVDDENGQMTGGTGHDAADARRLVVRRDEGEDPAPLR